MQITSFRKVREGWKLFIQNQSKNKSFLFILESFWKQLDEATNSVTPQMESRKWVLDTIPPDTWILNPTSNPGTFVFAGKDERSGVDHFECSEDHNPWELCESPYHFKATLPFVKTP